jgi:hypothetical protein
MWFKSIILSLFFCLNAGAQENFLGLNGGLSINSVERANYYYYKNQTGLSIDGLFLHRRGIFYAKSSFGLQQKGFSQELIFIDSSGTILGQGAIEHTRFNYLDLSEIIGLDFGIKVFAHFGAGFSGGLYLFSTINSSDFQVNDSVVSESYTLGIKNIQPFEFSSVFEAGLGIKLKQGHELVILSQYKHGLNEIRYRDYPTPNPWKNRSLVFKLEFRWCFGCVYDKKLDCFY